MSDRFYTDLDCKIIKAQAARRYKYRAEFLKARTDPTKHSMEAGYVFDPALQRFMSQKATGFDVFVPSPRNAAFGILTILPMFIYGYLIYKDRAETERQIRCGMIPYCARKFKFA